MDEIWVPLVGMIVLWAITFIISSLVGKIKGRFQRGYSGVERRQNYGKGRYEV